MKCLLIFCFCFSAVYGEISDDEYIVLTAEELKRNHDDCVTETSLDPDSLDKLRNGLWSVEDENIDEWAHCIMFKADVMTIDGIFNIASALLYVPNKDKAKVEDLLRECLYVPYLVNETNWGLVKCYHNSNPKYLLF